MGGTSVNDTEKQIILDYETGDPGSHPKISANFLRGGEGKQLILVDHLLWARHRAKNFLFYTSGGCISIYFITTISIFC